MNAAALLNHVDGIRALAQLMTDRLATLERRLHFITRAALNHIDGDSQPSDTHWSEIVGLAEGDPNWLRHAQANYDLQHARLVELSKRLIETAVEHVEDEGLAPGFVRSPQAMQRLAAVVADQIEQDLLPEMVLAENGRTFRELSDAASRR